MALKTSSYGTCHACKALNMAHRTSCYRCGSAITPPASKGVLGRLNGIPNTEPPRLERRQFKRHDVVLPGRVLAPNGEVFAEVLIRNIGVGGVMFDSAQPFQLHDQLTIEIHMEGERYVAEGIVKHCGQVLSNDMPNSTGLEFTKPDGALISCIARMDVSDRETWS